MEQSYCRTPANVRFSFLDRAGPSRRYLHLERHQAGDTAVDVASWLRNLGLERDRGVIS